MKTLCRNICNEIQSDIKIHNQHILLSSIDLPNIAASVYSSELCKRLTGFLAACPPSKPSHHVIELLASSWRGVFKRIVPRLHNGLDPRYSTALDLCKADKGSQPGMSTHSSTSPFVENMNDQISNILSAYSVIIKRWPHYILSLESFLSMKLSAINPELPFDIEQIFSKDILHSRDASLAMFGCGASRAHFPPLGIMQQEMAMCNMPNSVDMMRSTFPQVSPMPQLSSVWDDELQTVLQMGFIPNQSLAITDPNGTMKTDE